MYRGYIKLWRKSLNGGMLKNAKLWVFWSWCLMKATHKPYKQVIGFQEVVLEPGQFIFGRKAAADELDMSEQTIRTSLSHLKKAENLTIKSTNKYSIVTIVNWELYQGEEDSINQQTNKQQTSDQPATNHKQTHKEQEEHKELPPPYPPRVADRFSPAEIEIEAEAKRVIVMVNDVLGKNFPDYGGHMDLIKKHLRKNVQFEQFEEVVRKKAKDPHFIENPNLLNPFTLFGKKFEIYLTEDESAYGGVKKPEMITHRGTGQEYRVDCEA